MILKAPLKESINIAEEKHQRKDLLRGPRKQIHFSNGDINLKETLVTLSTMCVCLCQKECLCHCDSGNEFKKKHHV